MKWRGMLMHGPIDYLVIEFPGNNFKGEILNELNRAIENQTIAVLDLSLITKDVDGNVSAVEVTDPELFGEVVAPERAATSIINEEDVDEIGELLQNNSSAGLLVIEHLWARDLKRAIINADGNLVAEGRIHPDAYEELTAEEEV
jgi:hypothetical protein